MTLIRRKDAINAVWKKLLDSGSSGGYIFKYYRKGFYDAQKILNTLPSVEAEKTEA